MERKTVSGEECGFLDCDFCQRFYFLEKDILQPNTSTCMTIRCQRFSQYQQEYLSDAFENNNFTWHSNVTILVIIDFIRRNIVKFFEIMWTNTKMIFESMCIISFTLVDISKQTLALILAL